MTEQEKYPGTGQMIGIALTLLSIACAGILLLDFKELLQGHFDKLPFFENFYAMVSRNDAFVVQSQAGEQKIVIPQSVFFISALSMLIFAFSITAGLIKVLLQVGVDLICGGSRKRYEQMIIALKGKF